MNGLNVFEKEADIFDLEYYDGKIYLKEYGVWEDIGNDNYKRDVTTYDVSNYRFDSLEDYVNDGIDKYYNDFHHMVTEEASGVDAKYYSNPYVEVEKYDVDYIESTDWFVYSAIVFSFYIFYVLLLAFFVSNTNFILGDLRRVSEYFNECRKHKKITKESLLELQNIHNKVLELIDSNEEIRSKFNILYESNKYLLDNPEELYRRFDDASSKFNNNFVEFKKNNVKKLTKKVN